MYYVIGLKMVLNTGSTNDYLYNTLSGGMHIIIQQQGIVPFPDAAGFDVGVGQLSSYGYKPVSLFASLQLKT